MPAGDPRRPQWTPYAAVQNLDKAAERVRELGGKILRERTEVAGGTLVVVEDPTGASLVLWEAA
ncbi:VOC family protein [Fodinicola feengrottensis]|uniref:VOC family protein n=1 Tax=Fodinicola feengrottensis TaxID=435914 RepID=UPI0036F2D7BC